MASLVNISLVIDDQIKDTFVTELQRGFYKVKRKAIRKTLRNVAQDARENIRRNKLRSGVPLSGTHYGRTYGKLTASIRHNEETGTVSAGGDDIYHAELEDSEEYRDIYPVEAPRLKFIWWRLSGGTQLVRRYKTAKTKLVVSKGPIYRRGSGFISKPWREHTGKFKTLVYELAKEEGII